MNLLSVHRARSIWLGVMTDFNPRGASLYRILFPLLVDTYKFRKFPPLTEIGDLTKGVAFEGGEFPIGNDPPVTVDITFYNDGVVADTSSSTDHSDAFLGDAFTRLSEIFKMPHYQAVIKKILYLNEVYVTFDKSLEIINPKMKQISKYLSENVQEGNMVFQLGGLQFWPDQVNKSNPAPFKIERVINVPFSENRYYSSAPLPTDKHLELLDQLEDILS